MTRRVIITILTITALCTNAAAQMDNRSSETDQNELNTFRPGAGRDSTSSDKEVPVGIFQWTISPRLGNIVPIETDTMRHRFQNTHFTEGMNGEYSTLGNMGSPRISRIYMNRGEHKQFMFNELLDYYYREPEEMVYSNTKSPFTNLTYYTCGNKNNGEDRIKVWFSTNINKRSGVGFIYDYLYGRGYYNSQSTAFMTGDLYGYYHGDHYQMHVTTKLAHMKMAENGGISDYTYIVSPEKISQSFTSQDIPTYIDKTWNINDNAALLLSHRYNLGFYKEKESTDTANLKYDFVPVTSFIHTMKIATLNHTFKSYYNDKDSYFRNKFVNASDSVNDIAKNISIKNTFGISLREGFNKYAMAGLTAFISHEFRSFEIADSTAGAAVKDVFRHKYRDNIVSVGGQLIRTQGKALHYNVTGEMALTGEEKGSLSIEGVGELNIPISKKDTASIQVKAFVKNQTPTFYYRHFHSQHLWWNNELSKQMRTRVEGTISLPRTGTSLTIGNEIVKNYTYLALGSKNSDVCVRQAGSPIHVFSATVRQALKLGIFNWEGEVNYQKSSSDVIPLPQLNAYTNLFIDVRLAKVLRIELGADARYFTEYYAPAYSPILMQFYNQAPDSREKVGNYPLVNLYANCHLKHTRFYVMMSHVNEGSGSRRYFNFPGYPMNPSIIKFGVSWNFFN